MGNVDQTFCPKLLSTKRRKYVGGDSSKLQGDLNFAFDQRESEVNLHKATSLHESPSNVSPDHVPMHVFIEIYRIR
jgi:hypothetical protein